MRRPLALAAVVAAALPALARADALLDRYQAASTAQATAMQAFLTERVPELAAVLPPTTWDDDSIAVARCTLDGVRAARGDAGVEAFVAATEEWAAVPVTSFGGMGANMPEVLSDSLSMELAQSCGGMELAMRQMQESGMMAVLQRPDVMERLMALE